MEKKKTYVLMLSEFFPKTHNKAGMPTEFKEKVLNKKKIHTIRANFPLWEKRIKEIQEGRAVLSIRQWTGEPYRSKQVEIVRLAAEGGLFEVRCDGTPLARRRSLSKAKAFANEIYKQKIRERLGL